MKQRDLYFQHLELGQRLGALIRRKTYGAFDTKKEVIEMFARITDLKTSTASTRVKTFHGQGLGYAITSTRELKHGESIYAHLNDLERFYRLLGVDPEDEIIALTQQINPSFTYDPHEEPTGGCSVQVQFEDEASELTAAQQGQLEKLAIAYARENKKRK